MLKHTRRKLVPLLALILLVAMFLSACSVQEVDQFVKSMAGVSVTRNVTYHSNGTEMWEWVSGDFNPTTKDSINDQLSSAYSMDSIEEDPTVAYNCHSYAWYSQDPSNIYWINDPAAFRTGRHIGSITANTDTIPSWARNGDMVDYYNSPGDRPHSARVHNKSSNMFISKWSFAGLYVHKPTKTCYNDGQTSYTAEFGFYR